MAISKKKRFDILSRDWHWCMYCGRKPPYVMLEVDHIIPKSKWWSDRLDNLITSCFDCNRWKWWDSKEDSDWKLYKKKIDLCKNKIRDHFYKEWNDKYMWTIEKNTLILFRFYIDTKIDRDDIEENISVDNYIRWLSNTYDLFILWWEYCDDILDWMSQNIFDETLHNIEYIYDDENRKVKERYNDKMNYWLTEELASIYPDNKKYVIRKFTLYPDILQ